MIRTARRVKQGELAERVGVTQNFISLVESGKRIPSVEVLARIADAMQVPSGLFLLWQEPNTSNLSDSKLRKVRELLTEIQAIYLEGGQEA